MSVTSTLKKASENDLCKIVEFLSDMSEELGELDFDKNICRLSVSNSFKENVHWFLFVDENGLPFGTCYMQSLHNYWRMEKRFHLGGFYILPSHRGQGRFRNINSQLKYWAESQNGVQIYAHIHKDNEKSLGAFESVGLIDEGYCLRINHWGD